MGTLLKLRYLAAVVALFAALHAIAFLVVGVKVAWSAYGLMLSGEPVEKVRPGIHLLQSMDAFLVALVFLILALGIAKLFLLPDTPETDRTLPRWLRLHDFLELKLLLWEAILLVLTIAFVAKVVEELGQLNWELLILPASILMLAISYFLQKWAARPEANRRSPD